MKTFWVAALSGLSVVGVGLIAASDPASAQRGHRDYGYDEGDYRSRSYGRSRGDDEGDRRRYRDRTDDSDRNAERGRDDDEDRDRRRSRDDDRMRDRDERRVPRVQFDEDEYLRCHPDVRRAVERGDLESGALHYRTFGRREGRKLTCPLKV